MCLKRPFMIFAAFLFTLTSISLAQRSTADLDIPSLILEANHNGVIMSNRMFDYTFTQTMSYRLINKRGKVKETPVQVYEVYPMPGRRLIKKLVSENGVPVSPERAAKELKHVTEELEKAEREEQKRKSKLAMLANTSTPPPSSQCDVSGYATQFFGADGEDIIFSIADFLCAGEFFAPRRERLHDREMIVLSFRPRADYVPPTKQRAPIAKLIGTVWIDAVDKVVSRLEAWPVTESSKEDITLPSSSRPDAALVYEQVRLADGTWIHASTYINTSRNPYLFNGVNIDFKDTFTNFQRFSTGIEGYKVDAPKPRS